jgi:hypothetical protein
MLENFRFTFTNLIAEKLSENHSDEQLPFRACGFGNKNPGNDRRVVDALLNGAIVCPDHKYQTGAYHGHLKTDTGSGSSSFS